MNRDIDPRHPRFRTIGPKHAARLILQCSSCEVDIRELKPKDVIDVTRAYYCSHCDTGTVIENPVIEEKNQ
jgi:hypothetical protein